MSFRSSATPRPSDASDKRKTWLRDVILLQTNKQQTKKQKF